MVLHPIECGNFKLDGGAMLGVVPKVNWQKIIIEKKNEKKNLSRKKKNKFF